MKKKIKKSTDTLAAPTTLNYKVADFSSESEEGIKGLSPVYEGRRLSTERTEV